jgi:hypothetical protein
LQDIFKYLDEKPTELGQQVECCHQHLTIHSQTLELGLPNSVCEIKDLNITIITIAGFAAADLIIIL